MSHVFFIQNKEHISSQENQSMQNVKISIQGHCQDSLQMYLDKYN